MFRGVTDVLPAVLQYLGGLFERFQVEQSAGVLVRRVPGLVEAERVPEDDVEGGRVVPVASRVAVLGFLVVLAAAGLGTDRVQTLGRQHAAHPGQHNLLIDGRRARKEDKVQRNHRQKEEIVRLGVEVVEHFRMGSTGDRLLGRPTHHATGAVLSLGTDFRDVLVGAFEPHTVLREENRSCPGQGIVDDDWPERVHVFVRYVRRQRSQLLAEAYHSAARAVAKGLQRVQIEFGQAKIVDQELLVGQLGCDVLCVQNGRGYLAGQSVRYDREVVPRPVVQGLGESEQGQILGVYLRMLLACFPDHVFLQITQLFVRLRHDVFDGIILLSSRTQQDQQHAGGYHADQYQEKVFCSHGLMFACLFRICELQL